jgi:hypothetical protein
MATLKNTTVSRFHNLSNEALADAIGRADAIVKGAEAELATGSLSGRQSSLPYIARFHPPSVMQMTATQSNVKYYFEWR